MRILKTIIFLALAAAIVAYFGGFIAAIFQTQPTSIPWYVSRTAGIVSYLLMFLIIYIGTGMTTGFIYKMFGPVKIWTIHQYLGIALVVTLSVHIISITFDTFIKLTLKDVLVPFTATYQPLYLSLGIFGFYILLITVLSSLTIRVKTPRFWRVMHFLTYPLFVLSFIHGVFIGTDSHTLTMRVIYWATGLIFLGLLFYRYLLYYMKMK